MNNTLDQELATAKRRPGRPPKKVGTDWELLAKHLQKSLEGQIDENERLCVRNGELAQQSMKLLGVIEYLEVKWNQSNSRA